MIEEYLHTPEETVAFGRKLAKQLPRGSVVCFSGELGAGKTTLIKGLVSEAIHYPEELVNSPTYVYMNIYTGNEDITHFDLYRLNKEEEFFAMGFDEYIGTGALTCIEWPERIANSLPTDCIWVTLSHATDGGRIVQIH